MDFPARAPRLSMVEVLADERVMLVRFRLGLHRGLAESALAWLGALPFAVVAVVDVLFEGDGDAQGGSDFVLDHPLQDFHFWQ